MNLRIPDFRQVSQEELPEKLNMVFKEVVKQISDLEKENLILRRNLRSKDEVIFMDKTVNPLPNGYYLANGEKGTYKVTDIRTLQAVQKLG